MFFVLLVGAALALTCPRGGCEAIPSSVVLGSCSSKPANISRMCCGGDLVEVEAFNICRLDSCCCYCSPTPTSTTNKRMCYTNNGGSAFQAYQSLTGNVVCNNTVAQTGQVVPTVVSTSTTTSSPSKPATTTTAARSGADGDDGDDGKDGGSNTLLIVVLILLLLLVIGGVVAGGLYYAFARGIGGDNDGALKRSSHSSSAPRRSRRSTYTGGTGSRKLSRVTSRQVLAAGPLSGGGGGGVGGAGGMTANVFAYDRVSAVAPPQSVTQTYQSAAYVQLPAHVQQQQYGAAQTQYGNTRTYTAAPVIYQSPPATYAATMVINPTQQQGGETMFIRR